MANLIVPFSTLLHAGDRTNSGVNIKLIDNGDGSYSMATSGGNSSAKMTSDVTTISGTFVNVTGMSFAIGANETWSFAMYLFAAAGNVANCEVAINGPAAPTAVKFTLQQTGATPLTRQSSAYDSGLSGITIDPSTTKAYILSGIVRNGATAGTVILRIRSLDLAATGIAATSYVTAQKIS